MVARAMARFHQAGCSTAWRDSQVKWCLAETSCSGIVARPSSAHRRDPRGISRTIDAEATVPQV